MPDILRLRAVSGTEERVYGPRSPTSIMAPLHETGGVVFPTTPRVSTTLSASWEALPLVHANQDFYHWRYSPSPRISIEGMLFARNNDEGRYMVAVIHFLKTITKGYYGLGSATSFRRGMPPDILILEGYGRTIFDTIPVLVLNASLNLPADIDYVPVSMPNPDFDTYVPIELTFSIEVVVQNSPVYWVERFDLERYRSGALLSETRGWF